MSIIKETARVDRPADAKPDPLRVLVLDDDDATRLAIGQYLEHCGHVVGLAATIDQALLEARSLRPQVVVCDWRLGDVLDGVDAARMLKSAHGLEVVFVTAHSLVDLRRHLDGVVPAGCLRKPLSLVDLSVVVDTAGRERPTLSFGAEPGSRQTATGADHPEARKH